MWTPRPTAELAAQCLLVLREAPANAVGGEAGQGSPRGGLDSSRVGQPLGLVQDSQQKWRSPVRFLLLSQWVLDCSQSCRSIWKAGKKDLGS